MRAVYFLAGAAAALALLHGCAAQLVSADKLSTIGTGVSQAQSDGTEITVFEQDVSVASAMTHFWITGGNATSIDTAMVRYYVDGEEEASIEFQPALACGTGFGDERAPWGNSIIGHGASVGGWYHNLKIPFYKSIKVTLQTDAVFGTVPYYMIVRGAEGLSPLVVGGVSLPPTARLYLDKHEDVELQPVDFLPVVNRTTGSGMVYLHMLKVQSQTMNFLEGCYHAMSPYDQAWPGVILSTGTEDYYDSAYYFDAGFFQLPVSGLTHLVNNGASGDVEFSAYRFHDEDPIVFHNGLRMLWRNGDMTDPKTGIKCTLESGGNINGKPTKSTVTSYSWVYVW